MQPTPSAKVMFCIVISTFCAVSTLRLSALTIAAPPAENGVALPLPLPPPLPPAGAATVRVLAALARKSTTTGTCSSVRSAPFSFIRATVVVHPSLSAVLFLTRSSEWHEAQTVFTRFAATASGPLEVGAAPSGAWARITRATPRRNAPTFKKSLYIEVIIRNWRSLKKRGQDLYFVFRSE